MAWKVATIKIVVFALIKLENRKQFIGLENSRAYGLQQHLNGRGFNFNLITKDRSGLGYNDLNNIVDLYHAESAANEKTKKDRNQAWQLGTPNKHQLPPLPRKRRVNVTQKQKRL